MARLGESTGFSVVAVATGAMGRYLSAQALWVFLSRDPGRIASLLEFATQRRKQLGLPEGVMRFRTFSAAQIAGAPLWTDDYSDLFGAMEPISVLFTDASGR